MEVNTVMEIVDALLGQPISLEQLCDRCADLLRKDKCDRTYPL